MKHSPLTPEETILARVAEPGVDAGCTKNGIFFLHPCFTDTKVPSFYLPCDIFIAEALRSIRTKEPLFIVNDEPECVCAVDNLSCNCHYRFVISTRWGVYAVNILTEHILAVFAEFKLSLD